MKLLKLNSNESHKTEQTRYFVLSVANKLLFSVNNTVLSFRILKLQ